MTDHFREIYANKAALYEAMVSCEDYQENILPALEKICPLKGLDVVEFGTGTGRFVRLLAPLVKSIHAFDASAHMLEIATETLSTSQSKNWELTVGDNRNLPADDSAFDLAIAGWSFGHSVAWYPDSWRDEIQKAINEMWRVLKPDGTAIIFETMGTGSESPAPPFKELGDYYAWMENDLGFDHTWIRTDYQFESVQEADELTRFFFGDELADRIVREALTILPECTGIWWKRNS